MPLSEILNFTEYWTATNDLAQVIIGSAKGTEYGFIKQLPYQIMSSVDVHLNQTTFNTSHYDPIRANHISILQDIKDSFYFNVSDTDNTKYNLILDNDRQVILGLIRDKCNTVLESMKMTNPDVSRMHWDYIQQRSHAPGVSYQAISWECRQFKEAAPEGFGIIKQVRIFRCLESGLKLKDPSYTSVVPRLFFES